MCEILELLSGSGLGIAQRPDAISASLSDTIYRGLALWALLPADFSFQDKLLIFYEQYMSSESAVRRAFFSGKNNFRTILWMFL